MEEYRIEHGQAAGMIKTYGEKPLSSPWDSWYVIAFDLRKEAWKKYKAKVQSARTKARAKARAKPQPRQRGRFKIGRCCLTCCWRAEGPTGKFVKCNLRKDKPPVWGLARCSLWELTLDSRRLIEMEKRVDLKVHGKDPLWRFYYYAKYNDLGTDAKAPLTLGRICAHCVYKGKRQRLSVECTERNRMVSEWGVCNSFNLPEEGPWLKQMAKYIRKSGEEPNYKWWVLDVQKEREIEGFIIETDRSLDQSSIHKKFKALGQRRLSRTERYTQGLKNQGL